MKGDLDAALSAWSSCRSTTTCVYNRGVAHLRAGQIKTALEEFERGARSSDTIVRANSLYNLGTHFLRAGTNPADHDHEQRLRTLSTAVEKLDEASRLAPDAADARGNLLLARASLMQVTQLIASKRAHGKSVLTPQVANDGTDRKRKRGEEASSDRKGKRDGVADEGAAKGKSRPAPSMTRNEATRLLNETRGREAIRSTSAVMGEPARVSPPDKDW